MKDNLPKFSFVKMSVLVQFDACYRERPLHQVIWIATQSLVVMEKFVLLHEKGLGTLSDAYLLHQSSKQNPSIPQVQLLLRRFSKKPSSDCHQLL